MPEFKTAMNPGQFFLPTADSQKERRSGTIRNGILSVICLAGAPRRSLLLPLHRFIKNVAVQRILARKRISAILHTEHHERPEPLLRTERFPASLRGQRYLQLRENCTVHLEFSPAAEEK